MSSRIRTCAGGDPAAAASEALAGHRGAAGCRHRRLDHGQRPASGKPQRPRRADHRRPAARDSARPHLRRSRRSRADRPAAGRSARAAACRQDLRRAGGRHGVERFFRKPNLMALRELALRRMTDRVEAAARARSPADRQLARWLARDRVLVAIGPDRRPSSSIRAGKRIADALDAMDRGVRGDAGAAAAVRSERDRRIDLLRLAESLGAETVTLDGPSAADALLEYAPTRNATRVIVGAPKRRGWRALAAALDGDRACRASARASTSSRSPRASAAVAGAQRRPRPPARDAQRRSAGSAMLAALAITAGLHRCRVRACIRTSSCPTS